jgi:hypothetical protein
MMAATASLFASSTGHMQGAPIPPGTPEVQGTAVILQGDPAPSPDKDRTTTVVGQWAGGGPVVMGEPAAPPPKPTPRRGRPATK